MADAKPSAGRPTQRAAVGVRHGRSVAEAVLRQAEVPVFLMRQTKAQVATRAAWEAMR